MDKKAIVKELAENRVVEGILAGNQIASPYIKDLAQDIYLQLLEKKEELITGLHERGELLFFIRKIITNNIFSRTSPYYRQYEDFRKRSEQVKDYIDYGTE